jgi:hypothetical protein
MSKFKNKAKEFFGLREQDEQSKKLPVPSDGDIEQVEKFKGTIDALGKSMKNLGLSETELDEAQLVNNITDYQGHVMYRLRDPQEAKMVAKDIMQWTNKKGFTIIEHDRSGTGLTGYFYFRLGEDPGTESQRIQGYLSQMPEIEKFIFKQPRSKQKN